MLGNATDLGREHNVDGASYYDHIAFCQVLSGLAKMMRYIMEWGEGKLAVVKFNSFIKQAKT